MTGSYLDWLLFTAKRHAQYSMLLSQAFLPFSPSSLPPLPTPPPPSQEKPDTQASLMSSTTIHRYNALHALHAYAHDCNRIAFLGLLLVQKTQKIYNTFSLCWKIPKSNYTNSSFLYFSVFMVDFLPKASVLKIEVSLTHGFTEI